MALDTFDLQDFLRRMAMHFGGGQQAPAWMTSPHATIAAPAEDTSGIPQVGGEPWYQAHQPEPLVPAVGFQPEPQDNDLAQFLAESHDGGIQGPRMEDIQIHRQPGFSVEVGDPQIAPHYGVDVGEPQIDDEATRKRKAALASMGGP